jgi:hypothetical protein
MLHQRLAGRACLLLALIGCASRGDLPRAGGAAPGPAAAPAPATNTVGDDPTSDLAITFHPGVTGHVGWAKLPRPVPLFFLGEPGALVIRADADGRDPKWSQLQDELFAVQLARTPLADTSLEVKERSLCSQVLLDAVRRARPSRLLISIDGGLTARGAACLAALPAERLYVTGCLYRSHRRDETCDGDAELAAILAVEPLRARVRGLAVSLSREDSVKALAKLTELELLAIVSGRNAQDGAHFHALPFVDLRRVRYLDITNWLGDVAVFNQALPFVAQLHTLRWSGARFAGQKLPACALRRVSADRLSDDELQALASCADLRELSSDQADISSAEPLARWTRLQRLHLRHFHARDLAPLAKLTNLELLGLPASKAHDFRFVATITNLREVDLSQTDLGDASVFAGLPHLEVLDVGFTGVRDLSPLRGLTTLVVLDAHATNVVDIAPLAGLTALAKLSLSHTEVTDLSPLARHPALAWVILYGSRVTDASVLLTLPRLRRAHIGGLKLPPDQVSALRQRLGNQLDGAP